MPDRYFEKFPVITYNDYLVRDITNRGVMLNSIMRNPYLFYPYQVAEGERPDQIADRYYNDQYMSWILYLSNKTTDPYYEWYLSPEDFLLFLRKKYSSEIYALQEKVIFYRNNWYDDERILSISEYTAMANTLHRYWQPVYTNTNTPSGYQRVQKDWVITTNNIRKYAAAGNNFIDNEIVNINFSATYTGKGQVISSNSTTVLLQHTNGTTLSNNIVTITGSSRLYGSESKSNVVFTSATSIANNLPAEDVVYWSPVYIYDYENELNEQKKTIKILDSNYAIQTSNELTSLLT